VGDANSFVTPEDHGPLRSLERFIGRGIVRKRAEGFDYHAAAAPREERGRRQLPGPVKGRTGSNVPNESGRDGRPPRRDFRAAGHNGWRRRAR
jgi:ATP-dependent RNA helicase RhlE